MTEEPVANPEEDARTEQPHPHRWRIFGVSLVIGFMALLDVTIVNVAIPSIQDGLGTSPATVQWVVSGYALAFGLTLVTGGRLGDALGRRRMMLVGLAGFIVASGFVGFAPDATWVVAGRLAQGASAGLLTPQNSGLIQQLFRGRERARAFGLFGLVVSISSATGPVLGGLIIAAFGEEHGWRYIFLVNIPIGVLAMIAVVRMVPQRPRDQRETGARLDLTGAALLGAAVLCVLLPTVAIQGGDLLPLLLLVGVVPLAWAFVRRERRLVRTGGAPLLDIGLLRRTPGYANGVAVGTLYFTGFTGFLLVLSVYFQQEAGLSPLQAGLLMCPFAIGSAITAPLSGRVVSDLHRKVTVTALAVMMTGVVLVAALVPPATGGGLWAAAVPAMFVAGLGGGGVVSPNMTLSLEDVPPRMGGAAGGALQTGQRMGASIGAALAMSVYHLTTTAHGGGAGLRAALMTGFVLLSASLVMAVRALRQHTEA
ncbi:MULTISPECIES: MFS transporter [unclassified Nocardioides]|uniref:MFS transporter n=1 Tax=unclassified Nocardioides TaxID=2615069 RepID=UPI00360D9C76